MKVLKKNKVATENFVWQIINNLEERMEKRFGEAEKKAEERFDKVMTALVDIAGQFKRFDEERVILADRQSNHEDRIEKLEKSVFRTS